MSDVDTPAYHVARIRELHTELADLPFYSLTGEEASKAGRIIGAIGYHIAELERLVKP